MRGLVLHVFCVLVFASASTLRAQGLPEGYWSLEQSQPILDKTLAIKLSPDLSHLSGGEKQALEKLLAAGQLFHELYLQQRHSEALTAVADLKRLDQQQGGGAATQGLLKMFWSFKGPIATTLENKRVPFLPVAEEVAGKAVYPGACEKTDLDAFLQSHPEQRPQLLHDRSVVRETTAANLARHRQTLTAHPALATLNREFATNLTSLTPGNPQYYAVPYAVEYADRLTKIFELLSDAATAIEPDDPEFAGYLRNRARDLLTSDYEAGDAAWITGQFGNINAEIGSYETYDDALFGVKAFYAMSILARDPAQSAALADAIKNIQEIEDSLPYEHHKRVRSNIPVHVCNVIADFGQARGTNTATILPNDPEHSRKYGRTILLRNNIMMNPELFDLSARRYRTAVAPQFRDDLTIEANFQRTLWHEIGHYLGVDRTVDGRPLDEGLLEYSDLYEEMKADLVSLFAAKKLSAAGVHSEDQLQAIYASGILRVLQLVQPRPEQPYQTMQLIQWNFFLEKGLLSFEENTGLLSIDYDKYHDVATQLLEQVLAIQRAGDPQAAGEFVTKYTEWKEDLHEVIANRLRNEATYRYRHVSYGALE